MIEEVRYILLEIYYVDCGLMDYLLVFLMLEDLSDLDLL